MGVYEGFCTKSAPKACQTVTQRGKTTPGVFKTVSNAKGSSPVLPASSPSDVVEPLRLLMLRFIVGWEMLDLSISEGRSHDVSSVTARRKTVTSLSSSIAERSTCPAHHRSFAKLSVCYTVAGCGALLAQASKVNQFCLWCIKMRARGKEWYQCSNNRRSPSLLALPRSRRIDRFR